MKVIYIAHPIGGDVHNNLAKITHIVRNLNRCNPNIVPFVPYYADCLAQNDDVPAERSRGIANNTELLTRPGVVDEVWLFGPYISPGMAAEVNLALQQKIPVVATTEHLHRQLQPLINQHNHFNGINHNS